MALISVLKKGLPNPREMALFFSKKVCHTMIFALFEKTNVKLDTRKKSQSWLTFAKSRCEFQHSEVEQLNNRVTRFSLFPTSEVMAENWEVTVKAFQRQYNSSDLPNHQMSIGFVYSLTFVDTEQVHRITLLLEEPVYLTFLSFGL